MFFNLGGAEILVIALVALIAVGPEQLPSVLRKLGRFVSQARSITAGLRDEFMSGLDEVKEVADPESWMGSGAEDDPVVPRGYAERQARKATAGTERGDTASADANAEASAKIDTEVAADPDVESEGDAGADITADADDIAADQVEDADIDSEVDTAAGAETGDDVAADGGGEIAERGPSANGNSEERP